MNQLVIIIFNTGRLLIMSASMKQHSTTLQVLPKTATI